MISLVPLIMLAGFGYGVYRWSSSRPPNSSIGQSQNRDRGAAPQAHQAEKAVSGKTAARTATGAI